MSHLPLLGEDAVVQQYRLFDPIGGTQNLLTILLGICLNPPDLGTVHPPLNFCIIHLWEGLVNV